MGTSETATILSILFSVLTQPIFERNNWIIQVIIILSLRIPQKRSLTGKRINQTRETILTTESSNLSANSQSSTGLVSHSLMQDGMSKSGKEAKSLLSWEFVELDLESLSTTIASHDDFRGRCIICTWQPRKELIKWRLWIKIEAVTSPFTCLFNQPK